MCAVSVAERFGVTGGERPGVAPKKCLLPRSISQKDEERNRNKNAFLFVNYKCFFMAPPNQQFLNRQIYYCIQFAIYGVLRSAHHQHRRIVIIAVCSAREVNCIKAFLATRAMCRPPFFSLGIVSSSRVQSSSISFACHRNRFFSYIFAWRVQYENKFFRTKQHTIFNYNIIIIKQSLSLSPRLQLQPTTTVENI